jgi:molybdopterin converting factor small subunit
MNITIQFNGVLRSLAGGKSTELGLGDFATVGDAMAALAIAYPHMAEQLQTTACAIGDALVHRDEALFDGADLVLLPPVSGG